MNTSVKRYVFTDFENIQKIQFKKLERVCDKIFILINSSDQSIPLSLVKKLQKLGKAVKWIPVENNQNLTLNYHICYLIGKMHVKISRSIEFAILSDDDSFDPMMDYINSNHRKCRRVRTGAPKKTITSSSPTIPVKITSYTYDEEELGERAKGEEGIENKFVYFDVQKESMLAYQGTKDRLKLVATRPYNLTSLKDYIHINNQEMVERGKLDVEKIIEMMETNNEIEVKGGLVAYHF